MERKMVLGKCDYNGSGRRNCKAVITWKLENGNFSMCAEIWNPRGTDCYTCGQCVDKVAAYFPENQTARRMVEIWERWHLNYMKAGTPRQEAWLREHKDSFPGYPTMYYDWACIMLRSENALADHDIDFLQPDMQLPCDGGEPYYYGAAWLKEEIPADVIAEIESWGK